MRHFFGLGVVDQALHGTSLEQMLADNLRYVILGHAAVKRAFGVDNHDGTKRAKAETTGLDNLDLLVEALLLELLLKVLANRGLPLDVQPVPPQINTCERIMVIPPLFLADRVFVNGLAALEMLADHLLGLLGRHLDVCNLFLASSNTSTMGSRRQIPMQPVCETVTRSPRPCFSTSSTSVFKTGRARRQCRRSPCRRRCECRFCPSRSATLPSSVANLRQFLQ